MALYSKKEFSEICGIQEKHISTYFKRGKIIIDGKKIDSNNIINAAFIKEKSSSPKEIISTPIIADYKEVEISNISIESEEAFEKRTIQQNQNKKNTDIFAIDAKLKIQTLKKLEVDTRIQYLKEEKIKGELIPVMLVESLFRNHTQSIITANKDGLEQILINISMESRLSSDQLARIRKKMITILNDSVDKAITITEKSLRLMVEDFSITKQVGEHE